VSHHYDGALPELIASCGLSRVHRCSCGTLRLTVGPVTVTLSQAALEQVSESSQAALIALAVRQDAADAATARHLSLVENES